jgi:predicted Rossmann-fold nucleotide-binding protein
LHRKPCGLLNVDGFYDGLLQFLDHAWTEGFIKPETRAIVSSGTDPVALLQQLLSTPMPAVPQWISPRER